MLIVIAGLALVVVFLASKPVPGDGQPSNLPPPGSIPATGTSGVPSPAASLPGPHGWGAGVRVPGGMSLMGTNAGQLAALTNGSLPATTWAGAPQTPAGIMSSGPQSAPLESKELFTGVKSLPIIKQSSNVPSYRKI